MPWTPQFETTGDVRDQWWTFVALAIAISWTTLTSTWWEAAVHGTLLFPLYTSLAPACDRLTVTVDGVVVRGVLRRSSIGWASIRNLELRRYQVTADIGRHGKRVWRFDGRKGRPSASEVAGVLERLRRLNPSAQPRYRTLPSWGALVLLIAAAPTAVVTIAKLLG